MAYNALIIVSAETIPASVSSATTPTTPGVASPALLELTFTNIGRFSGSIWVFVSEGRYGRVVDYSDVSDLMTELADKRITFNIIA